MDELCGLANQSAPASDADLAHADSIQAGIIDTADLLANYISMLKGKFDARTSLGELYDLYANSPAQTDIATKTLDQILKDSSQERELAIRNASPLHAAYARAAFVELFDDSKQLIMRNRATRHQSAHETSTAISEAIQKEYAEAFKRGLRIPKDLPVARNELELQGQISTPTQEDVEKALRLAQRFRDSRASLDMLADQAKGALSTPYPFHNAAQTNQLGLLNDFHALGVPINIQRPTDMKGVLHIAAAKGQLSMVQWIVGLDETSIETRDIGRYTPLALAARNGHTKVVDILIEHKADVLPANKHNIAVIFDYQVLRNRDILLALLDAAQETGRSVSAIRGRFGRTLLIEISNAGGRGGLTETDQIEIAKKLIEMGIDPKIKDKDGATARSMAKLNNAHSLARSLKEAGG